MKKILMLVVLLCLPFAFACLRPNTDATYGKNGPRFSERHTLEVSAASAVQPSCDVARDAWNDAVGFAVFEAAPSYALADVVVEDAPNRQVGDGDSGYLDSSGKLLLNVDASDAALAPYLCAHELGHALGLAHDADPSSIMHHYMPKGASLMEGAFDFDSDAVALPRIRVSGEDREAVRRAYGRKRSALSLS